MTTFNFRIVEFNLRTLPRVEWGLYRQNLTIILVEKLFKVLYNRHMENLKEIIASNIVRFRSSAGLTQIELAEKLNYSDKSVSKWERAQGIPDIGVLKEMADMFGIKVDDFLIFHEDNEKIVIPSKKSNNLRHVLTTLISCGLVWLVATLVYVVLNLLNITGSWKCFIYAIPATMIVATVFSAIWGRRWCTTLFVSLLVWTSLMSVYITFIGTRAWLLFIIGIPLQILIILGSILLRFKERKIKIFKSTKKIKSN